MPEISNRTNCSLAEIDCLRTYLSQTPVHRLVKVIDKGARVSRGEIKPLSQIGRLRTMWGELDGIYRNGKDDSEKFLVKEIMPALRDPQCHDAQRLCLIEGFKRRLLTNNKLELKITLFEEEDNIIMCDGNSRTVAYFEYGLETRQSNLSLPVYIINPHV